MKKLLFRAPVQTASGYGVHSRMLLKSLDRSGKFDIVVMSVPWGNTPLIYEDTPEMLRIKELSARFNPQTMRPEMFDVSVQVTIPNEFMPLARRNIGVTAGIETDRVSGLWHQKCNEVVDAVVVPSVHSARSFTQAIYNLQDGKQLMLRKPLYVLPEWVDTSIFNTDPVGVDPRFDFPAPFNFITVGLGMDKDEGNDRKNITLLVKWFCEQFRNDPNVGLVLKVSMVNASPVDFKNVANRIRFIKQQTGCGQYPRIHLIHGRLGDQELAALYKHPKVKAFVSLTHGEGFGLPLIEAAACGLPIVATNWSGHLDFLHIDGKRKFVPVDYELKPIPPQCVWKDVLDEGTRWAFPLENDAKMKMAKVVLSYDKPKEWANELAAHIAKTFNKDLGVQFAEDVYKVAAGEPVQLTKNALVRTAPSDQELSDVTLVAVSTNRIKGTLHAIDETMSQIKFGKVVIFTTEDFVEDVKQHFSILENDPRYKVVVIPPFADIQGHDQFMMKEVVKHIETGYFMTIQWDGYVLNGSAWTDEFLKYDYVGAPWFWNNVVGNAALCLRSKRLAEELAKDDYPDTFPQDTMICEVYRKQLEERGFKFAPPDLARRFSVENEPYTGGLGWHGVNPFNGVRIEG